MTRVTSMSPIRSQIVALAAGGGTNLEPAFKAAREALQRARAKIKHMIILTDGQTAGIGYEAMASQCRAEGITISTVAIGEGSHVAMLQAIASAGGGQSYLTQDISSITQIFTQDTMMHTGQMLREEPTESRVSERHAMLEGIDPWDAPPLLGYVKTIRKASAQLPLVTDGGDPLLATWRYGLGKVTAFTSDAKSRWAGLWLSRWQSYAAFWAQVLRETARPPQGQLMDLHLTRSGEQTEISVDLMSDAMTRANGAKLKAEVFHIPTSSLGAPLQSIKSLSLSQNGVGRYFGSFTPQAAGVYLIQVRSGDEMVSAGLVHQPLGEAGLGTVNEPLLAQISAASGGQALRPAQPMPPAPKTTAIEHKELWPWLALTFLLLWLFDIILRRWEHVQSLMQPRQRSS